MLCILGNITLELNGFSTDSKQFSASVGLLPLLLDARTSVPDMNLTCTFALVHLIAFSCTKVEVIHGVNFHTVEATFRTSKS